MTNLREFAPRDNVVPLGAFLSVAILILPAFVGGDAEGCDGNARGRVANFRIAAEIADQHDFVQALCHAWFLSGESYYANEFSLRNQGGSRVLHNEKPLVGENEKPAAGDHQRSRRYTPAVQEIPERDHHNGPVGRVKAGKAVAIEDHTAGFVREEYGGLMQHSFRE